MAMVFVFPQVGVVHNQMIDMSMVTGPQNDQKLEFTTIF